MAKSVEGIHQNIPVNPERKWLRIQEVGLAQFLAMPFAMLLLGITGLATFGSICLTLLVLGTSGYCCFRLGHEKRQEIARNTHNEQST